MQRVISPTKGSTAGGGDGFFTRVQLSPHQWKKDPESYRGGAAKKERERERYVMERKRERETLSGARYWHCVAMLRREKALHSDHVVTLAHTSQAPPAAWVAKERKKGKMMMIHCHFGTSYFWHEYDCVMRARVRRPLGERGRGRGAMPSRVGLLI